MIRRPTLPLGALLAVVFLVLVVAAPVVWVVGGGVLRANATGHLLADVTDPVTVRALQNSLVQGLLAAAGAVALGAPAGAALGRYAFPGRTVLRGLLLVPFLLPSLTMVVAVSLLLGPAGVLTGPWPGLAPWGRGLPGVVLVDVLYNAPLVALLTAVGTESGSRELEDTVRTLGGSSWRGFVDAWGRPALTGAAAGGVLAFTLSALAFAAPIAIGGAANYTVEARIWSLDQILADPSAASVVAAVAVALLLLPTALYFLLFRRLAPRSGGSVRAPLPISRRDPAAWLLLGCLALLVGVEGVVLGSVLVHLGAAGTAKLGGGPALVTMFSPGATQRIGIPLPSAFVNSVVFATFAAVLALLVGLGLASASRGRSRPGPGPLTVAPLGALLISPIVLALALSSTAGGWVGASGVWILIVLSQATLALPFLAQSLGVALARVPSGLREAALSLGSSPGAAYLEVELPAARDGIAAAGLLAVALCLGEFTATYFLAIPRYMTASVALYRLTDARLLPEAGALAAVLVLASAAILAATALGGRRVAF
jgi:thiamine transport system permease protein